MRTPALVTGGEMAIFEHGENAIHFVAERDTELVLGSAAQHPHDLVLGNYSVHTSVEALRRAGNEIRSIGEKLRTEGLRSYALDRLAAL